MHDERAARPPEPTPLRAVVFDLDGTLVDTRAAVVDAVAAGVEGVLRRHGIDGVHADRAAIEAAMGLPSEAYYRAIVPARLQDLVDEVQTASTRLEVQALERGEGRLFPGIAALLAELRAAGLRLAVISNAQAPYFHAALRCLGLARTFEHSECHGDLPPGAPAGKRALLARALTALRVPASSACMVGDRADDVAAGRELGCRTVGVTWGFADPGELAAAGGTADRPADLLPRLGVRGGPAQPEGGRS
jgi:phosphoglycolate phosphatase